MKIICAAIKLKNNKIIRGHRHADCLRTAERMGVSVEGVRERIEGFMTSENEFVDRKEAHQIHKGEEGELYSEDLY